MNNILGLIAATVPLITDPSIVTEEKKEFVQFMPDAGVVEDARSRTFIQLKFNENALGCFPSVTRAMTEALQKAAFYPDDPREALITQLSKLHGVEREQILVSNGLSSLLFILASALISPGTHVVVADPTYDFFMDCVEQRGGGVVTVPLGADYAHDLEGMLEKINEDTRVVLLCNPNNPTGTITSREDIDRFIERVPPHVYIIVDEAYHHFVLNNEDYVSLLDKPSSHPRMIVGRTFSKAYGMAGMRLGYIVASKETIAMLGKYYDVDTNNVAALVGGSAALADSEALSEVVSKFEAARREFYKQASDRKMAYIPSHTNFVMFAIGDKNPQEVQAHFEKNGILIGKSYHAIPGFMRVTLGTPEQMTRFWEVWDLQ